MNKESNTKSHLNSNTSQPGDNEKTHLVNDILHQFEDFFRQSGMDIKKNTQVLLGEFSARFDLVSRDEYDRLAESYARTRKQLDELTKKVQLLEQQLNHHH